MPRKETIRVSNALKRTKMSRLFQIVVLKTGMTCDNHVIYYYIPLFATEVQLYKTEKKLQS
jgi:hypothetical protein